MVELFEEPFEGSKEVSYFGLKPLYYKPEQIEGLFGSTESVVGYREYMEYLFIRNSSTVFGFYTGVVALNHMHGTTQVPVLQEIISNNVDELVEYQDRGFWFKIYPASIVINSENHRYLQVMSVIEKMYDYFEEDVVQTIKSVVKLFNLNLGNFELYFYLFSEKTKGVVNDVFA